MNRNAARAHDTFEQEQWPPPILRGVRVLVVDDDEEAREFLVALLSAAGAEVRNAESAADALTILQWWWPAVLVSDIGMPRQDGYALIEAIRALPGERARTLPAAALTAFVASSDRARALRAGYQVHLGKPVDPDRLIAVLSGLTRT